MKYHDGQSVMLGDKVKLGKDENGIVVCLINSGEYSDDIPKEQWSHLEKGVMIEFPLYGLIHYETLEPDIELVSRKA